MLVITCQNDRCCLGGGLDQNATYDAYELSGLWMSLPLMSCQDSGCHCLLWVVRTLDVTASYELSGLWMSLPLHLQSMLPQRYPHRRWTPVTPPDICRWYSPEALESMFTEIHIASKSVGLGMHLSKNKVMLNENATTSTVAVHGNTIDKVDSVRRWHKLGISFLRSRGALHWDEQHSARWPTSWRAGRLVWT